MSTSDYHPRPIDTSAVSLTPDQIALTEKLAENAHDIWAKERQAQGWTWGEERNDTLKLHPCLVPYADLPDSEKQFDRSTAMGTLMAMLANGTTMETPSLPMSEAEQVAANLWQSALKTEFAAIVSDPDHPRRSDFDQPELASGRLAAFPILEQAIQAFEADLAPTWRLRDKEANVLQGKHRRVAWWAIMPGLLAILLSIVQLALPQHHWLTPKCALLELAVALVAAVAVFIGYGMKTRNRWLAARQAAERLRMLKFRALADLELWCDPGKWRAGWQAKVSELAALNFHSAEGWVHGGSAEPAIPGIPACHVPAAEVHAIADYYRTKRHQFQHHYFTTKAGQHKRETWMLRLQLPVALFFLSVVCVIAHAGLEAQHLRHSTSSPSAAAHTSPPVAAAAAIENSTEPGTTSPNPVTLTVLLALAAALPVMGFGLRAWFSAFELPRRAQLFAGKAEQLKAALQRIENDRDHPRKTFTHLELGEHFYENEHREWCRLILEAEWFV